MTTTRRANLAKIFSDEWQLPIALATGVALLVGYSLQVLVDESFGRWSVGFHAAGTRSSG